MAANSENGVKASWNEPVLEALEINLSAVASGSNNFIDGSAGKNNLSRNS